MMDRLVAANDRAAVYVRDTNAPQKKMDPFRYINDLLSIRSAKGLVEFLDTYPNGLHTRRNSGPIEEELQSVRAPTGKFAFGETAMMNAAEQRNLDYLDALTDLQGYTTTRDLEKILREDEERARDITSRWTEEETRRYFSLLKNRPQTELSIVAFADLESLVSKMETTLMIAALSYYEIYDDLYTHFQPMKALILTRNVSVRVDKEWLCTLLPFAPNVADDTHVHWLLESIEEGTRMHGVQRSMGDNVIIETPTQDFELGLRYAAGCVVSFLLSRWNHYFSVEDRFSYDIEQGYVFSAGYTNPIVLELSSIISEHRFGVCPICGRPFVVKRRPVNGAVNKTFCTNSCKVKGNADGRWRDRPMQTLQLVMPDIDLDKLEFEPPEFVQVDEL